MNPQHLAKLKQEQERAVVETEEKIKQWEKFKSDYEALKQRLQTLPDRISHDVMVPFGSLAFMPGKLVHTNEILVLLGDNWFAERSAKQAADIVMRRLKSVEEELADLKKQKKLLEPRIDFTSELQDIVEERGDVVEIKEEYDAEKEKAWKEQHRKNVQRYRKNQLAEMNAAATSQRSHDHKTPMTDEGSHDHNPPMTDEEMWAKLDDLEKLEAERHEFRRMSDDEVVLQADCQMEAKSDRPKSPSARVRWEDQSDTTSSSNGSGADSDDEGETSEGVQRPTKISFTHTKLSEKVTSKAAESDSSTSEPTPDTLIQSSAPDTLMQSPADVYKYFGQVTKPKSILKKVGETQVRKTSASNSKKRSTSAKHLTDSDEEAAPVLPAVPAFTDTVVEKNVEVTVEKPRAESVDSEKDKPKRISKFKAQRQKLPGPR